MFIATHRLLNEAFKIITCICKCADTKVSTCGWARHRSSSHGIAWRFLAYRGVAFHSSGGSPPFIIAQAQRCISQNTVWHSTSLHMNLSLSMRRMRIACACDAHAHRAFTCTRGRTRTSTSTPLCSSY